MNHVGCVIKRDVYPQKMYSCSKNTSGKYFLYKKYSWYINRGYLFFSLKDRNLFHRVDTIGNILTSGAATSENITDGVHEMK